MQPKYKIVLLDVDGVLLLPPKMFSAQYCEKYGVGSELQGQFYATKEFQDASVGKFDLKEALRIHNDKWQWQGDTDELLQMWFEGENYPNNPLIDIVEQLRANGTKVYLATQQEKYRKTYLEDVIFKDKVDGIFCSCDIGYNKHDSQFWEAVLDHVKTIDASIEPADIVYFDDRQNLVDLAREHGIAAFVYETPEQVQSEVFAANSLDKV
ncbi:MAG: HAD family hydrolase [Candidatus Saccharimonadales bacterium]